MKFCSTSAAISVTSNAEYSEKDMTLVEEYADVDEPNRDE